MQTSFMTPNCRTTSLAEWLCVESHNNYHNSGVTGVFGRNLRPETSELNIGGATLADRHKAKHTLAKSGITWPMMPPFQRA
jgi:hypothetical protein